LVAITFTTIVASLVVHGISGTPLMTHYEHARGARRPSIPDPATA
jgi:NhaP-type Na+/H+ or K+/H+ antiporter